MKKEPGGEGVSQLILHVDDVEPARVSLPMRYDPHAAQVSATRDHAQIPCNQNKTPSHLDPSHFPLECWMQAKE